MKTIFQTIGLFFFLNSFAAFAQKVPKTAEAEKLLAETDQEKIYIHYNTPMLFPGEYLLYKLYNLTKDSGHASDLSKTAFVELIGEDGTSVFHHKIKLEKGKGQGDFFLPTSVPSGNYKLVGYTNWMKNLESNFFEADVTVINPYRGDQQELLEAGGEQDSVSASFTSEAELEGNDLLKLKMDEKNFGNREQVRFNLVPLKENIAKANLSVSVRKLDRLRQQERKTAEAFSEDSEVSARKTDSVYLPHLRGQLVSGRIVPVNNSSSAAVGNKKVALSIPSEKTFPEIAATNAEGRFFFNLDTDMRNSDAVIEVLGQHREKFKVELDPTSGIDVSKLDFSEYKLTKEMRDLIVERSLYNQIENAYFGVKPDTLETAAEEELYFDGAILNYDLDAYTRFKTVPETFVEIINSAWITTSAAGERVFRVRGLQHNLTMGVLPLVVVDGMVVQDHSSLINFDAGRIKNIGIIRDKIFLGPEIFQGAVVVETIDKNFQEYYAPDFAQRVKLMQPQVQKSYFQQVYSDDTSNSRIPDFRYQLLWKPDLQLGAEEETLEFFTSDVDGTFEVVVEGFTADGQPVSLRKQFVVQ